MSADKKHIFRQELSPKFVAAAHRQKPSGKDNLLKILHVTEAVRSEILLPASKRLDDIVIETKETGDGREAAEKTFSIKTDHECEALVEKKLKELFPGSMVMGEEMFGLASLFEKKKILAEMRKTDKDLFIVDALDATKDFRMGGDGHSIIIVMVRKGEVIASVVHKVTDHADIEGLGQTITFAKGDGARINGKAVKKLSERSFPTKAKDIRGYACHGFLKGQYSANNDPALLKLGFDSFSDAWTCATLYSDMLEGKHHFMLIDSPVDLFDYPAALGLLKSAGGVARFMDGTDATIDEFIKRQKFGSKAKPKLKDTLVLAVSEDVFTTVQKDVLAQARPLNKQAVKLRK